MSEFDKIPDYLGIRDPEKLLKLIPLDSKYFTPAISDLRIGYEYEQYADGRPGYPDWVPNCRIDSASEIEYIESGEWVIRVPYLTKEQIEAEGWKVEKQDNQLWYCDKGSVHIAYFLKDYKTEPTMKIELYGEKIFRGECKDINTFRYICKLLGI